MHGCIPWCLKPKHGEYWKGGITAALSSKEEVTLTVAGGRQKVKNTHTYQRQYDVKECNFAAKTKAETGKIDDWRANPGVVRRFQVLRSTFSCLLCDTKSSLAAREDL